MASVSDSTPDLAWEKNIDETDVEATVPNSRDRDISSVNGETKDAEHSPVVDADAAADLTFSVWWEEPADQDPANPMNWPASKKWSVIGTISFITFLT